MRSDNTMITPRKTTGIRLTVDLDRKISEIAKFKGVTKNSLIVEALWDFLERESTKNVNKVD